MLQAGRSSNAAVLDLAATLEAERAGQSVTQNVGIRERLGTAPTGRFRAVLDWKPES